MAVFSYRITDQSGKLVEGSLSAKNKGEVADILRKKGNKPLVISEQQTLSSMKGTVPMIEKITFCHYVAAMLNAGLSLSDGISVLEQETKHPLMKKIIGDVAYNLEKGQQLSLIFSKYPDVFDQFFLTLVEAGEVSGKLGDVFSYLEKGLRSEYSLQSKIKGALMYPVVVFAVMISVGVLMFFFVLPQIGKVFLNMRMPLPAATRALFTISVALSAQMVPIVIGMVVGLIALVLFARSKSGKKMLLVIASHLPLLSRLMQVTNLARFTRIFSTLLRSAVPITQALEIAVSAFSWNNYQKASKRIVADVAQGKALSVTFKEQQVFPGLLIQMIAAGEKTGALDKSLADLATFYEEKVEEDVKNATQLLEPILILGVGIGVGAMILSIIAPIYSVVSTLQGQVAK